MTTSTATIRPSDRYLTEAAGPGFTLVHAFLAGAGRSSLNKLVPALGTTAVTTSLTDLLIAALHERVEREGIPGRVSRFWMADAITGSTVKNRSLHPETSTWLAGIAANLIDPSLPTVRALPYAALPSAVSVTTAFVLEMLGRTGMTLTEFHHTWIEAQQ